MPLRLILLAACGTAAFAQSPPRGYSIPFIDLAAEKARQTVVDREPGQYLGHPTTVLLEDRKTMIIVYPKGHGRGGIVMKRSSDAGRTWSGRLPVPDNWSTSLEVPTIHRVVDPAGARRLILFSGLFPIRMASSEDDGLTWTPLAPIGGFGGIVAMGDVIRLKDGSYMAVFHDDGRFLRDARTRGPFVVYKTLSRDGGRTWSQPEPVATHQTAHLCEPGLVRSPDGGQIAVLLRENSRKMNSFISFSADEGKTWSEPRQLPGALTGDRHVARYAPDGRLFVTFRDTTLESPTRGDWVAWVGRYEDLVRGSEGQYRVRLMDNHKGADCCYPGVESLPDGSFVTTTYGHWTPGEEPYIVSVRLQLSELDARAHPRLAHVERVAPGVWTAGFGWSAGHANTGWVEMSDHTVLVDLPRGLPLADYLAEVRATTARPVRKLVLTRYDDRDAGALKDLTAAGVREIVAAPAIAARLPPGVNAVSSIPGGILAAGALAWRLEDRGVLFAGPLVVNGPRAVLTGRDTAAWTAALRDLEKKKFTVVIPGHGSVSDSSAVSRQRRMLAELRRQVGYVIARGMPREKLTDEVRISSEFLVWMNGDTPAKEDVEWVWSELTAPHAPFNGKPVSRSDAAPHALVLIGDSPHEPGHLEEGLRPVFEAAGVIAHFTVDVRTLNAENLGRVNLLAILRDGWMRPSGPGSEYMWMTRAQQEAVADFVAGGGSFLVLHNSMGLYPEGPYLETAGGHYMGHPPLERFRVEVVDRNHPVTRGVSDFTVADEQHTPWADPRVRLLLRNRAPDGRVGAAGWVHEAGRGRVCHLANGHTREALGHPMSQLLLRNAVNWLLRR